MKKLLITFLLFCSHVTFAGDKANYSLEAGSLQTGGSASVTVTAENNQLFKVKVSYNIKKKAGLFFIPTEYLNDESNFELPGIFSDEKGYESLKKKKTLKIPKYTLQYTGLAKFSGKGDGYKVRLIHDNGHKTIDVIYHHSIEGAGWSEIRVTLNYPIPGLNGYQLVFKIK
jgi:hypothetical protein